MQAAECCSNTHRRYGRSVSNFSKVTPDVAWLTRFLVFLAAASVALWSGDAAAYMSTDKAAAPALFRPVLFVFLVILPGAWIGFSAVTQSLGAGARFCLSIALSPLVLFVQFYILRNVGVPVASLPLGLLLINAPAIYFILKARKEFSFSDARTLFFLALVPALPLGFLAYSFHDEAIIILRAHNWLHADIAYQFLGGKLLPEEMALAGEVTAYPWAGHIYQAIMSATLHATPSVSFIYTNIVWLLALFGFAALIAKSFGGGLIAQMTAPIWVSFAVNPVGLGIRQAGGAIGADRILPWDFLGPFFGDPRYGAFLQKYYNFNQMPFAFALLAALVYLMVVERPGLGPKKRGVLMGLVLLSMLIIYPVFLPVGCGVVFARIVAIWVTPEEKIREERQTEAIPLVIALVAALTVAFPYYEMVLQDRVGGGGPQPDFSLYMIKKMSHTFFALSLPIGACALVAKRLWPKKQTTLLMIGLIAIGLIGLHIFVHVPNWRNEYKYIMAASVALTPLIGVALEPIFEAIKKRGRLLAIASISAACITVAMPGLISLIKNYGVDPGKRPDLYADGIDLRFKPGEPLAGALDAIRTKTPPSTLIIFSQKELYLPTVARRTAYTPYNQWEPLAGISFEITHVLYTVKGYSATKYPNRVDVVTKLYEGADNNERKAALEALMALSRPAAIIVNRSTEPQLDSWLKTVEGASAIHEDEGHTVWLVSPENQRPVS